MCSLKCPRLADKLEKVNKMLLTNSSTNYKILWFPNQQPGIKIRKGKEEDFDLSLKVKINNLEDMFITGQATRSRDLIRRINV